eukprot:TRINITY_DN8483_c0_g1_i3.p1 TRINITY_DN8483_c0_g1~~TRINITY_DN8483_c0_g1_i3.p1  ORF type:complete len:409 (+),score=115.63 TRINITY_DN8483_c0_g1_i3:201-1427(+)
MLVTGSVNTLSTKWADKTDSQGRQEYHEFDHPFFQAAGMFLGELSCLMVFYVSVANLRRKGELTAEEDPKNHKWGPTLFVLPACCDMCGTSLMYVGLTMTSASIFQMLRGSVVIFTGILSVTFLKRKLMRFHWASMFLVLLGVAVVGLGDLIVKNSSSSSKSTGTQMLGNGMVIAAQMITAIQMVVEEKFIGGHNVPALAAVGWEGFWGLTILSCALVGMYFIPAHLPDGSHQSGHFEDSWDAMVQISNSWKLVVAIGGNILSIAFFNYFGISVTKVMSASHRMVIDSVRTIVIWGFSLAVGWEKFSPLQLVGFVLLISGTVFYQEIWKFPFGEPSWWGYSEPSDHQLLDGVDKDDGLEDPEDVLGSAASPHGKAPQKKSFTTFDETSQTGEKCAHRGSMTGSFLGNK